MALERLFLGVDGGQSSTTALIGDSTGRVLGMGRSGPCNHVQTGDGREKFLRAVGGSIEQAHKQAGLTGARYTAACLGFSGGPADKQALVEELVDAERLVVTHDALIALTGATAGEPGIITIAGTGSISFGRNREGRMARAGGWGYVYGDEGGGFDITRQAVRSALREHEGWGPKTALTTLLLEATGCKDANEMMHRFYTAEYTRPQIAALSRLVDQAAEAGDAVAREILMQAAQHLALYTAAVRRQLFAEGVAGVSDWRRVPQPSVAGALPDAGGDERGKPICDASLRSCGRSAARGVPRGGGEGGN
jgi:N-acetylglucosamine kinase-like BadF-type ATPase